jgi:hypothetical protein
LDFCFENKPSGKPDAGGIEWRGEKSSDLLKNEKCPIFAKKKKQKKFCQFSFHSKTFVVVVETKFFKLSGSFGI